MSKAGIIKRHLNWTAAESISKGLRIPWSPYIVKKLEVCESEIQLQEGERVEAALSEKT